MMMRIKFLTNDRAWASGLKLHCPGAVRRASLMRFYNAVLPRELGQAPSREAA